MTTYDINDSKHVRFYYIRNEHNQPFGCVCLIRKDDNTFSRGMSICNFLKGDRFSKQTARGIAFSRANKAASEHDKNCSWGMMEAFSDYLKRQFTYILKKYHLGIVEEFPPEFGRMFQFSYHTDVILTAGEREMWRDFIDPNFVHKPRGK